ncbi:tRNA-specific adenosine deaminase 1 [Diabrotica undecimpunctata]|uniref:tRNA-specific adenosine deaminase 1 n=1 Tax=Diabrotica undecimpunctata TaxID=50387 RepID=UPI003B63F8B1
MYDKQFHNKIAKISINSFKMLPKSGKPNSTEWTVLSCIVQEFNNELTVVALGTGSKCIGKSKMSSNGDILNDSHAEVICRRSFVRYIYDQMSAISNIMEFKQISNKFFLNPEVKFHFFTTLIPCGDAAIFPMQTTIDFGDIIKKDTEGEGKEPPHKKVKLEPGDIFRTGAKCVGGSKVDAKLPGIDYHITGVVRTKPGRGDPTLSVSCSDKMAKWVHLGIQGSLLGILLDAPIYLSSFTLIGNTPFCEQALERAFYDRLEDVSLLGAYKRNKMILGQSSLSFEFGKDENKQACPSSVSWCAVDGKRLEVAVEGKRQGVTKKKLNTEAGRLKICKVELFKKFMEICDLKKIQLRKNCDNRSLTYVDVKSLNKEYIRSWEILRQHFKTWTLKDNNLFLFSIK